MNKLKEMNQLKQEQVKRLQREVQRDGRAGLLAEIRAGKKLNKVKKPQSSSKQSKKDRHLIQDGWANQIVTWKPDWNRKIHDDWGSSDDDDWGSSDDGC